MTHTCSYKSYSQYSAAFLYYLQRKNDFCISLFNSIIESESDNNLEAFSAKYRFGDQYHRCNNISNTQCNGYHFITTQCLLFELNTLADTTRGCMKISGYTNSEFYCDKEISHCNFLGKGNDNKPLFYLESETKVTLTISNSILLHTNSYLVQFDDSNNGFFLVLNDCTIPADFSGYDNNKVKTSNCKTAHYDKNLMVIHPHYTTGDQCKGVTPVEPESAKNCNVGDCIENCDRSIEFPSDVLAYTTIFHGDIQTPTPTPTEEFSQSDKFSETDGFTTSEYFSKSLDFSDSKKFSQSMNFTGTSEFSKTDGFSLTSEFSRSFYFTNSNSFTASDDHLRTKKFSPSKIFTNSQFFSETSDFTKSKVFSETSDFTKSKVFSETSDFTKSKVFSETSDFTKSKVFSETNDFTKSKVFSETNDFTKSKVFSETNDFTKSKVFSETSDFTKSKDFIQTVSFTNSEKFSMSLNFNEKNLIVNDEKKLGTGPLIGIVIGSVAAAAIIAALIAFFIIRKRNNAIISGSADMVETQDSSITVDNNLNNIMDEDDPFAEEFKN